MSKRDSRIARIGDWWRARAPRERLMLALMIAMIGGFALWYGVLVPGQHLHETSSARQQQAAATLARVRAESSALLAFDDSMPLPPAAPDALRDAVLDCARRAGLAVSRERSEPDGQLVIEADSATPGQMLGFLDTLRQRHGLAPATLSAAANGGLLRVQATFVATP